MPKPISSVILACGFAFAAANTAYAQFDNRYVSAVPETTEPPTTQSGDAILSYHRDEPTVGGAEPSSALQAEAPSSAPAEPAASSNPLRGQAQPTLPLRPAIPAATTPEPQPPIAAPPAVTPAMSTGPTESPAPIQTTPTTAPNPIPSLPASAPIQPPVNPFAIATPIYQDAAVIPASKEEPPASAPAEAPAPAAILDAPPLEAPPTALSQPLSAAKETPSAPLASSGVQSSAANRRLAPRTAVTTKPTETADSAAPRKFPFSLKLNSLESFSTAGAGLAIVVGLFLTSAWLLRRGSPKPGGLLPPEAFAVLGRSPLTPQSIAHLLRIGNKLVLVAVSADGAQPLTEITDPLEVDRLTGLCASGRGHGPAAEFQQVLAQLAKEPARGFLGSEASSGRRR